MFFLTVLIFIFQEIKDGVQCSARQITERTIVDQDTLDNMQSIAQVYNFQFSRLQVSAAAIPNGKKSIMCYTWMVQHFDLIGDIEPAKL